MDAWRLTNGEMESRHGGVGEFPRRGRPYGFTVFKEGGEPIVDFVYPTQEAARAPPNTCLCSRTGCSLTEAAFCESPWTAGWKVQGPSAAAAVLVPNPR